jgi:hypothetical protein
MLYPVAITVGLKTLGIRGNLVEFLAKDSESSVTFVKEEKCRVREYLLRKSLAPRGGFEPPTFRLTGKGVISLEVAGAKPNRREQAS